MLKISNVKKVFNAGTVNEKVALAGVSLTVEDGDFATIIGSNGAGKSTLFNCIGGSFYPDEGSIWLDDRDITYMAEYKRAVDIGRLFQDPMKGTAPHMTIEENLALAYLRVTKKKAVFSRISASERKMFRERLSLLDMGLEDRMK
ncbi:MAG: ATP-binding cassette domain-containing protein, partial [Lachnospiraceae bacterium]|nr:ATP-binding cassette domain-containing protein [Lachnospiraceae bacterium]